MEGEEPAGGLGSQGGAGARSLLEPSPRLGSALKERTVGGGGAGPAAAAGGKLGFLDSPLGAGGRERARLPAAEPDANFAPRRGVPRPRDHSPPRRAAPPPAAPHMSPMARFAMGEQASPAGARKPAAPGHGRRAGAPQAEVWGDPLDDSALTSLARLRKDLMVEYQMLGGRLQNLHGKAVFSGARARPPGGRVRPWEPGGVGPGASGRFAPAGAARKSAGGASSVWETQRTEWVFPSLTDGDFEDHDADWKAGAVAGGPAGQGPEGGVAGAVRAQQTRPLSRMWDRADLGEDQLDKWLAGFVEHDVGRLGRPAARPEDPLDAAGGRLASPNPALEAESTFLMPC